MTNVTLYKCMSINITIVIVIVVIIIKIVTNNCGPCSLPSSMMWFSWTIVAKPNHITEFIVIVPEDIVDLAHGVLLHGVWS